jgi:hypothetical protein
MHFLRAGFVGGNFECEFCSFIRSNQEQLRKMQPAIKAHTDRTRLDNATRIFSF